MGFNLITGDSHSRHLQFHNSRNLLCSAGSAKGLNNPHSVSQYGKKIATYVRDNYAEIDRIFFLFGGVDCDFSYIHKLLNHQLTSLHEFTQDIVNNYLQYIQETFPDKEVILLSVGLPTLDDDHLKTGLLNAHVTKLEAYQLDQLKAQLDAFFNLPNIRERTNVTLDFNERLRTSIEALHNPKIKFLDITSFTYDATSGQIKPPFFTRKDHHNRVRCGEQINIINRFLGVGPHPQQPKVAAKPQQQPKKPQQQQVKRNAQVKQQQRLQPRPPLGKKKQNLNIKSI